MGLDTTHDCWHGPYSTFNDWRRMICQAAGFGKLDDYKGFGGVKDFPANDVLSELLSHSDCDGVLLWDICKPLAERLESIAGGFDYANDYLSQKTRQFIEGLMLAHNDGENVVFH